MIFQSMISFILSIVTGAISHLQKKAQEVMRQKPKWQSYFQGQMIGKDDYDFISQFDALNAEGRAKFLSDPNAKSQVKIFIIYFYFCSLILISVPKRF